MSARRSILLFTIALGIYICVDLNLYSVLTSDAQHMKRPPVYHSPEVIKDLPLQAAREEFQRRVIERYSKFRFESDLKIALEDDGFSVAFGHQSASTRASLRPGLVAVIFEIKWKVKETNEVFDIQTELRGMNPPGPKGEV